MKITKQQIIQIHTLLPSEVKADKELKACLMAQYTGSLVKTSTSDLSYSQAKQLIDNLQQKQKSSFSPEADKKRKRIIYYAYQMNWVTEDNLIDMERINSWCIKYGSLHKPLMEHSNTELSALVQQFYKVYVSFLKTL